MKYDLLRKMTMKKEILYIRFGYNSNFANNFIIHKLN